MTNPMDSTNLENDAFYLNDKNRQHKNVNMEFRPSLSCWPQPQNPGEPADPIAWLRESGETAESNGFTSNAKRFACSANLVEQLQQELVKCDRERLRLANKIADQCQLIEELASLARKQHYYCEDRWYSCPKEADGCANEAAGEECDCGADEHNAEVDALMQQLIKSLTD